MFWMLSNVNSASISEATVLSLLGGLFVLRMKNELDTIQSVRKAEKLDYAFVIVHQLD